MRELEREAVGKRVQRRRGRTEWKQRTEEEQSGGGGGRGEPEITTMGSVDDKGCYNHSTNSYSLEFNKGNLHRATKMATHGRKAITSRANPTPSKWDDAQKWLVGHSHRSKTKPRKSNAEDQRLLAPMPQKGRDSVGSIDRADSALTVETKKIDCSELLWTADNPVEETAVGVRSVSLRDMGTEMTPIASKEPSRTGTPLQGRSRASSPGRSRLEHVEGYQNGMRSLERESRSVEGSELCSAGVVESCDNSVVRMSSSLENRAMAWDEAERTKYMARYKREEVKIQAWENRETRNAEMQMKRNEVKAERMKSRAQEKLANKMASTRRRAEEKRLNAEAKLSERTTKTSVRADYIRRAGHTPFSFFSSKLPSLCG